MSRGRTSVTRSETIGDELSELMANLQKKGLHDKVVVFDAEGYVPECRAFIPYILSDARSGRAMVRASLAEAGETFKVSMQSPWLSQFKFRPGVWQVIFQRARTGERGRVVFVALQTQ